MAIFSWTMEIISTRNFALPRETLFAVFADPAELALWWGPKGFTNTITRFDFRPRGSWRFANEQNFDRLEAYLAARTHG